MSSPIRVMIADDHPLVRSGLRVLLEREGEFHVVAEAADGYEAIDLAALHKPEVILLDVGMPRLSGPDAAMSISQKLPGVRIVMVSMHSDEAYVLRALKAGARGYLLKASPEADVLAAVRAVAAGNAWFSPSITAPRQWRSRSATSASSRAQPSALIGASFHHSGFTPRL